jgi:acyl carrier protein
MLERVRRMVADVFDVPLETVLPESSPDSIEAWDSLHHLDLVLALEQEFGAQFTPEEIEQLLSVALIANIVAAKVPAYGVA